MMNMYQYVFLGNEKPIMVAHIGEHSLAVQIGDLYVNLFTGGTEESHLKLAESLLYALDGAMRDYYEGAMSEPGDAILAQQELEDFAHDGDFENMEASEIL